MSEWQETEYGSVPSAWQILSIGELSEVVTDGAHFSPRPQAFGKYMCSVKDMSYNKFVFIDCKLISPEDFKKLANQGCQPRKGDILISKDGANCLDLIFVFNQKEEIVLLSSIAIVRLLPTCDPYYVRYFLLSPACQYTMRNNFVSGSAIPRVVLKDFKKVAVLIPQLPEQKAIAAVLSSLDDKIDLLHRQNKTLEAMAETLFRQWFVVGAQEDWEDTTLEQHTEVFRGLSYKGSGLTTFGLGIPMHNLNSVFEGGGYKDSGIKYYSGDFKERHIVNAGDIIVANTEQGHEFRLIGYPAIVPKIFGETGLFSQHIYRLILKSSSYITTEYLYYLLMTPVVREQVTSATNGSTVNMLAIDGLQRPEFKLPPKEKIVSFTEAVKSCWKKKEINQNQIRTLETLRDTLLPKLMSGEVRVDYAPG